MNIIPKNTAFQTYASAALTAIYFLLLPSALLPQEDAAPQMDKYFEMSLEDLMNVEVSVASKTPMTLHDSPGIISVITEEEIQNSGASDLQDILRLVPGFEFLVDVTAASGFSLRGNMGYIGRVLLMMDGQELNELFYACTFTGNHYPVANIKRIEIIRGPGSSIYGGFAELGVINIITKSGEDLDGIEVGVDYGQMSETFSHKNVSLSAGKKIDDFEFVFHGYYGKGNRSERDNIYVDGTSFDMADQSDINPMLFNAAANYKGLSTRIIYDHYVTKSRDYFGSYMNKAYQIDYESVLGEAKYTWKILDNLTIIPKYNFVSNTPWHSTEPEIPEDSGNKYDFDKTAVRNKLSLTGLYDFSKNINLIAGGEYYRDNAKVTKGFAYDHFWNGKDEVSYNNLAGFAQTIIKTDIVNMTFGARVDNHSLFGATFAPRLSLTKSIDMFHFKAIYNHAIRTPSIDEMDLNYYLTEPMLKPEKAIVQEFEVVWDISEDMVLVANFFYSRIDSSIVYYYLEDGGDAVETYNNQGTSGSIGYELEYRLRQNWGYLTLNYSYYNTKGINEIDYYRVMGHDDVLLGSSPHKVAFNSSFKIFDGLTVNPSFIYLGERYGNAYDPDKGEMSPVKNKPMFIANIFINYRNAFVKNMNLGLGVYNFTDADYQLYQGYNGGHPPLPERGARLILKASYKFELDK